MSKKFIAVQALVCLSVASMAVADMRITEWMYKGEGAEFIEFTNMGNVSVDMTGWKFADSHHPADDPSYFDLSAFGMVAPGESVVLTEATAEDFRIYWSLDAGVKIVELLGDASFDPNAGQNIGGSDTLNLLDNSLTVIDVLVYEKDTIEANGFSANPATSAAIGANDDSLWVLSNVGDSFGSYSSIVGDVGNPGDYVPEPATLAFLAFGAVVILRRSAA